MQVYLLDTKKIEYVQGLEGTIVSSIVIKLYLLQFFLLFGSELPRNVLFFFKDSIGNNLQIYGIFLIK